MYKFAVGHAFSPEILAVNLLDPGAKGTSEMNRGVFAGLDIDHGTLQAAVRPAGQKWFANTSDSGISEIANVLASVQPEIIVLEAQGGVELPVAGTLATTGLPLAFGIVSCLLGGVLYLSGMLIMAYNVLKTVSDGKSFEALIPAPQISPAHA